MLSLSAFTADTVEIKRDKCKLVTVFLRYRFIQTIQFGKLHIKYAGAFIADHVIMAVSATIKTVAAICNADLEQFAHLAQKIQIAVNCTKAEIGIIGFESGIDLIRRRMNREHLNLI